MSDVGFYKFFVVLITRVHDPKFKEISMGFFEFWSCVLYLAYCTSKN